MKQPRPADPKRVAFWQAWDKLVRETEQRLKEEYEQQKAAAANPQRQP